LAGANCLPAGFSTFQPAKKVRNKAAAAAAAAAAEVEDEDEEVGKAPPFMPRAKRLLAVVASRESLRNEGQLCQRGARCGF